MELNEQRLRNVKNAFVSGSFSLFSAGDIETICGLFVRTSSASSSAKSSDVWQYFGPLFSEYRSRLKQWRSKAGEGPRARIPKVMRYAHTSQCAESSHRNCPFPEDAGPHLTQYGIELAKANRRALQNGISIQSSCLSTAHGCDRHARRTDGHSCSSFDVELWGCWVAKHQLFSPKSCWIFQSWLEGVDRVTVSLYDFLWQVVSVLQHSVTENFYMVPQKTPTLFVFATTQSKINRF